MDPGQPPPARGYVAGALGNIWSAVRALLRAVVPHTADDAAAPRTRGGAGAGAGAPSRPAFVDPAAAAAPRPAPPPLRAAEGAPRAGHAHGALVGVAEGLERAGVLAPPPPGARGALAAAHEELAAERADALHHRTLTAAP